MTKSDGPEPGEATRALALAAGLVLGLALIMGWVLPTRLGGDTLPVVITGTSMAPTYQPGDLVITRTTGSPDVADVAVVRVQDKGLVVHRIQELTPEGPVTQGDALAWRDPWPPSELEVVAVPSGLTVPGFGQVLLGLSSSPAAMAALCAVVGGLVAALPPRSRRRVDWRVAAEELRAAAGLSRG